MHHHQFPSHQGNLFSFVYKETDELIYGLTDEFKHPYTYELCHEFTHY